MRRLMRRLLLVIATTLVAAAPAHAATLANWDKPEQRAVVHAGVLTNLAGGFHGDQGLTAAQMRAALDKLSSATGSPARPVSVPDAPITVALFHKLVVRQLG